MIQSTSQHHTTFTAPFLITFLSLSLHAIAASIISCKNTCSMTCETLFYGRLNHHLLNFNGDPQWAESDSGFSYD